MTIATEISKLQENLANAYSTIEEKGATLPSAQNFDNLATTISSIPSATSYTAGTGIDITNDVISVTSDISTGAALGATAVQSGDLATVATSGSYNDLLNKPDLSTKADVDLSNINTAGKSFVSGLGMPSSKHIDLTIGASDTVYTAPANGWFSLNVIMNGSNTFVLFANRTISYMKAFQWCSSDKQETGIYLPVKKGDVVSLEYNTTISYESWTVGFRFIYAEGAENV